MSRIVKTSLGQEATNLLRRMLLDGQFEDGQRLVEDRVANELGISRTPLREALHRLAQEGLLEKRRTGGYALRSLNQQEVDDAINIRMMLESFAAQLAASRATDTEVQALRANLRLFTAANTAKDMPHLVELNEQFHTLLREASHSPLLAQSLLELDGVVERMLRRMVSLEEAEWSDRDHLHVLEAIEHRQPDRAAEAMRLHVQHGRDKIMQQLQQREKNAATHS